MIRVVSEDVVFSSAASSLQVGQKARFCSSAEVPGCDQTDLHPNSLDIFRLTKQMEKSFCLVLRSKYRCGETLKRNLQLRSVYLADGLQVGHLES